MVGLGEFPIVLYGGSMGRWGCCGNGAVVEARW